MEWKREGKGRRGNRRRDRFRRARRVAHAREYESLVQNGSFETATSWLKNRDNIQPFVDMEKRSLLPR